MFIQCTGIAVAVDGEDIPFPSAPGNNRYADDATEAERVKVTYTYETVTAPSTKVCVAYEITGDGGIRVEACYYGRQGLPQLPVFGIRFLMPTCADKFIYKGLSRNKDVETSALHFDLGNLAFSCLPYTALELESATHQEELPLPRRTVLCIYGAVRGVGGIDSWGTDVEEKYWIDAGEDIGFSFSIKIRENE